MENSLSSVLSVSICYIFLGRSHPPLYNINSFSTSNLNLLVPVDKIEIISDQSSQTFSENLVRPGITRVIT